MAGWRIEGQYMETCNCTYLCPCPSSNLTARPTEGDCKAALAMRIDRGEKDGVELDGLSFIVVMHSPGAMAEGNITVGLIVDERATESRPKRSAPLPLVRPVDRWRRLRRLSAEWPGWKNARSASRWTACGTPSRRVNSSTKPARVSQGRRVPVSRSTWTIPATRLIPDSRSPRRHAACSEPSGSTGTIRVALATATLHPSRGRGRTASAA